MSAFASLGRRTVGLVVAAACCGPALAQPTGAPRFVDKLKATQDGEGSLLDHSLMLYGGPMANSNAHDHCPPPVIVFGHGAGRYRGNENLMTAPRTPMANLFMSIAATEDIELDAFGDSTGALEI